MQTDAHNGVAFEIRRIGGARGHFEAYVGDVQIRNEHGGKDYRSQSAALRRTFEHIEENA